MDYEKEYKSLVAKVKKAHQFAQTDSTKSVLEDILPQLRESEDEMALRIIKKRMCYDPVPISDEDRRIVENWLEKQKEQKPAEIDFEDWDTLGYIRDIVRKHVRRDEEFNALDKWLTEHYVIPALID